MSLLSIIEALRDFDTALLANTIGCIDPTPPEEYYMGGSIQSVTPSLGPSVGVAVTCEVDTSTPGGETMLDLYWEQVEQMSRMKEPSIWVVKTAGSRPDHECVQGDAVAKTLRAAGCVATVTDGGVRDVPGILTTGFAVYARGKTIHHCAHRVLRINRPVEIGGITVKPGDVLHANAEGVIRIPSGCLEVLAGKAVKMRAFEHDVHCTLRRTDVTPAEKRRYIRKAFTEYGFGTAKI